MADSGDGMGTVKVAAVSTGAGLAAAVLLLLAVCCVRRGREGRDEERRKRMRLGGKGKKEEGAGGVVGKRTLSNWRATYPVTAFSWGNHAAYVAEAVEHGWPAFALAFYASPSVPVASSLWHMCTKCALHDGFEPEITWDMGAGADYMQQVRFNPGLAAKRDWCLHPVQALQAALPLPGPALVPCTFPQDAYFELTVLAEGTEYRPGVGQGGGQGHGVVAPAENEYVKLLRRSSSDLQVAAAGALPQGGGGSAKGSFDLSTSKRSDNVKAGGEGVGRSDADLPSSCSLDYALHVIAVGLGAANAPPFRFPGADPGSVGYHSADGAVYLNGALFAEDGKKVQAKRRIWGAVTNTVGCGFDPRVRKVYFTLNGELVHEVSCKTAEYGSPLFPIVAANYDVTVMVNYGQVPFEYMPANGLRSADPSSRTPLSRSGKVGEDSGDLFSMGRIDSHWLSELESPNSPDLSHRHVLSETESDLFEIVLDGRA